jgi:hypothetical protein
LIPVLAVAAALAPGAVRVAAHHSFTAVYLEDEVLTIEGQLVELIYRNPHSYLHVLAPDRSGQMRRWAVEWDSWPEIRRSTADTDALRIGDRLVVTGHAGRDPSAYRLRLRTMIRVKDGHRWKTGR